MKKYESFRRFLAVLACSCCMFLALFAAVQDSLYALSPAQLKTHRSGVWYFNVDRDNNVCSNESSTSTSQAESAGTNLDYAGNPVLSEAQLEAIRQNQSIYEQAATQVDIPWQMIAVIHLRETGLKRYNPGNGQGVYQFVNMQGGPYPAGDIDEAEFLRQTILAAEFIKAKAGSNLPQNQNLTAQASTDAIKDTFFGYNGRAEVYAQQAASLGFDPNTQPFEGSPYVMNRADAQRDPAVNPTGWGQIKTDGGGIQYPANNDYGAFVVYASMAGISTVCSAGIGQFVWPVDGTANVSGCFGEIREGGRPHAGLDIGAATGIPVLAVTDGSVRVAGPWEGYGPNFVAIDHANGLSTSYGHMDTMSVKVGDQVREGQQIGTVGNLGNSRGSHLHINFYMTETGEDGPHLNPLQNGLTIPEGTPNPSDCK